MKKLSQFVKFDFEGFSKGKLYKVTGVEKWDDYDTKVHLGTRLKTVIAKDETPYKQKDGEMVTNLYCYSAFYLLPNLLYFRQIQ